MGMLTTIVQFLVEVELGGQEGRYLDAGGSQCSEGDKDATWTPYTLEEQNQQLASVGATAKGILAMMTKQFPELESEAQRVRG